MAIIKRRNEPDKPEPVYCKCSEKIIQRAYMESKQHQRIVIIPNVSWGMFDHEMDLCEVSKSGYITEIEIKISKQDLKADLDKRIFHEDSQNRIKYLCYAVPEDLVADALEIIPDYAGLISFMPLNESSWMIKDYVRSPKEYPEYRKLSDKEIIKLYRLGCLRVQSIY